MIKSIKNFPYKIFIVFVVLVGLPACTSQSNLEQTPDVQSEPAIVEPTPPIAESVTANPTPEPQVDECLQCHTDQQKLMDTANPVVVVEGESSGEG